MPSPFLDVKSFETREMAGEAEAHETFEAPVSHFLSVYGYEEGEPVSDPVNEEHAEFLNELYDEEMNDALAGLVAEAANLADSRGLEEDETGYGIEPLLRQHFAPLAHEAEALISRLASALANRDPASITESEIDNMVDDYPIAAAVTPAFENFLKKVKKTVKKVAKKAVNVAKKGAAAVAKVGVGPVLEKLKGLVQPLLNRVLDKAIGKLPEAVQPIATQLAEKLGILKRELDEEAPPASIEALEVAEIQLEFVENAASLLFAPSEVEQDLELVQARARSRGPARFPIADLDRARRKLIGKLSRLKEGEDPAPHIEAFVPAILPALKMGIQLAGRKRVVNFLAGLLAKLIQKYIGPQYAPALSQAMVDVGLRLIGLEVSEEDQAQAGSTAVAATIEETVRRVAALPEHVLDDRPLLQAYAVEAFEAAAASNLPPVLPERIYRKRPDLRPGGATRGAWLTLPPGARRKRFKKFSRVVRAKLTPHKVETVPAGDAEPLSEFLEDEFDLDPGEEFEASVHLYETLPGSSAVDIARTPRELGGLGSADAADELHPLDPHAAALLVGEPALGRESTDDDPTASDGGQRLFYLEVPGRRHAPSLSGRGPQRTSLSVRLDFPADRIQVSLYLSEKRAQELAVLLRESKPAAGAANLRKLLHGRLAGVFKPGSRRLKMIHESVLPGKWNDALRRLPAALSARLVQQMQQWMDRNLVDFIREQSAKVIAATEDAADGITFRIAIVNPPGFASLREALKGSLTALVGLVFSGSAPTVQITVHPGRTDD